MEHEQQDWHEVVEVARSYLGRFSDPRTRALREEIAQEAGVLAWEWLGNLSDPDRLAAAVRTITRRHRLKRIRPMASARREQLVPFGDAGVPDPEHAPAAEAAVRIARRAVPMTRAVAHLDRALARLSELDQRLLRGFHEGFCCAELATRYGRSVACVKTRIHRARRRVRDMLEAFVRGAGERDEGAEEQRG
jgi:DNA-directed RNA polymerase specialized sigma24 family protein